MTNKIEPIFRTKSLKEYTDSKNNLEFICEELVNDSNIIEGIILGIETIDDDSITQYQIFDHAKAYDYVINNYQNDLTTKEILNLHKILMNNIFRLENRGLAGEYRKNKVYIGPRYGLQKGGIYSKLIPKAMNFLNNEIINLDNELEKEKKEHILKNKNKIIDSILKIHNDFEIIHPFNDGNGRTGRLIINWLSLKYLNEFIIIDSNNKKEYYESINHSRPIYCKSYPEIKFYKDRIVKKNFSELFFLNNTNMIQ
ncbi:MAG: Fic family protein [Candidatus Woesearchaeota archaeon]